MRRALIVAAIFSPVPLWFLVTFLTGGRFEPHLPGTDTWNIQYLVPLVIALAAAFLAVKFKERVGGSWSTLLVIWNLAFAVLAFYAAISLWGEKY
jgi:hypothetical protein